MKTRITLLPTGQVPYESVYGQYIRNARFKRVAAREKNRWLADVEEPAFIKSTDASTGSFDIRSSLNLGLRNRFQLNGNK